MPTLRKDPVVERWVIIATERSKRPNEYGTTLDSPTADHCPFCRGNEIATPPPLLEYLDDDGGWVVRVVPNKFPALHVVGDVEHEQDPLHRSMSGVGAHEVIIEAGEHVCDIADLSIGQLELVLHAWRDRLVELRKDDRLKSAIVFKNHGAQAGASVAHAHSQLIALPLVPRQLSEELAGARDYFEHHGRCVFIDMIDRELDRGDRVVYANEHVVVLAPWASRSPFELSLLPRQHQPWYENDVDATYRGLADALNTVCRKLNRALDKPPYNLVLHSAPYTDEDMSHFQWHLELIPTLTKVAGFEWGAGFYVNPTPPEQAAKHLRNIAL